uniref:Putative c2h2-type zn-finger protein n=1 Tax=Xenopsylla cheopis TaxID=163159 RepID=A0A6M2DIN6_XENCH
MNDIKVEPDEYKFSSNSIKHLDLADIKIEECIDDVEDPEDIESEVNFNEDEGNIIDDTSSIDIKLPVYEESLEEQSSTISSDVELAHKNEDKTQCKKVKKRFKCAICNRQYKHKFTYNRHVKLHSGISNFKCETCGQLFAQKSHLDRHVVVHSGIKNFKCEICEKSFWDKCDLVKHHIQVHSNIKKLICEFCSKSFTCKSHLERHIKTHTGVKDFECDICNKLFIRKTHVERHKKIHSGIKEFKCDMCGKMFLLKTGLNRHMKLHMKP